MNIPISNKQVQVHNKFWQSFFLIDSFHVINIYQAGNYIPTEKKKEGQQIVVRLLDQILAKVK